MSPFRSFFASSGKGRHSKIRFIWHTISHCGVLGKQLRRWGERRERRIDHVFFCCVYDTQFEYFRYAEPFFCFAWSGLYVNSRAFRLQGTYIPYAGRISCPEKIVSLDSCIGVAVLDDKAVDPMYELIGPGKRVVLFPDVTDDVLDDDGGLAAKIRSFASGRKIVSLVDHLQQTKGLLEFIAATASKELDDAFFFGR